MAQVQKLFESCGEYGDGQSKSNVSVKKWRHQGIYCANFSFTTLSDPPSSGTVSATGTSLENALENLLIVLEEKLIKEP